jgi:hypothetical protein
MGMGQQLLLLSTIVLSCDVWRQDRNGRSFADLAFTSPAELQGFPLVGCKKQMLDSRQTEQTGPSAPGCVPFL